MGVGKFESDLVTLKADGGSCDGRVFECLREIIRHNDASHRCSCSHVLFHPTHVTENLTHHLVVGSSRFEFDNDEFILRAER